MKPWTCTELVEWLDTVWLQYPQRLQQLPKAEQMRFAQQQGYARSQDLLAHIGAWMEETVRVMPYLQHGEKPPRDYDGDDDFNARAVRRFEKQSPLEVEEWYEQQRRALKELVQHLPDEALSNRRVYRWLVGTVIEPYDEHSMH